MANSISVQTNITNVGDVGRNSLSSNITTYTTSSAGYFVGSATVGSGYSALGAAITSLPDVLLLTVTNDNTLYSASVVAISGSNANGTPIGATLIPGSQAILPNSQSITSISAKVIGGWPIGTPTPASASLAWTVQGWQ